MAAKLPDGSTVYVASDYAAEKKITAITNASVPVATATAHGLATGDFAEISSGWGKMNGRIFKVEKVDENSFKILGIDTTDKEKFPSGTGGGALRKITTWTQVTQILGFSTSGGEQQYANFSYLEEDFERQLPTITSAQSLTLEMADDPTLAGYQALKAANETRTPHGMQLRLRDGSVIAYNGIVSLNETPSTTKGEVMKVTASLSLQGRAVRY